jgi:hypothetical protein
MENISSILSGFRTVGLQRGRKAEENSYILRSTGAVDWSGKTVAARAKSAKQIASEIEWTSQLIGFVHEAQPDEYKGLISFERRKHHDPPSPSGLSPPPESRAGRHR